MAQIRQRHFSDEPVGHTCPDIDDMQEKLDAAIEYLKGWDFDGDDAERETRERDAMIKTIEGLRFQRLEQLRKANDTLRTWGAQGAADLVEITDERDRARADAKASDDVADDLREQIDKLEDKLEAAVERAGQAEDEATQLRRDLALAEREAA